MPFHVVTFTLISNLVTDYIQKRRVEPGLFSFDIKFSKTFFIKFWSPNLNSSKNLFLERLDQFSTMKNDFENQNFEMFEKNVHNFGKSDSDIV